MQEISARGLFFAAICCATCTASHSQAYEYVQPFAERHVISIQLTPSFVASGDRAVSASFCSPSEGYRCVKSEWLNFAVPLAKGVTRSEWDFGNHVYKVVGRRQLVLLGSSAEVLDIESTQRGQRFRYLYSVKKGLIAFTVDVDGKSQTFIAMNKVGFGSQ